jgi:hypothetical protein
MEFWDSVFNVFNFLFALLGLATIILGAYILIKGPIKYQPPLVEPIAARVMSALFIVFGFLLFFKLSEDYWPVPETMQDLIFWAIFFLLISSPVFMSRLRKQAN